MRLENAPTRPPSRDREGALLATTERDTDRMPPLRDLIIAGVALGFVLSAAIAVFLLIAVAIARLIT